MFDRIYIYKKCKEFYCNIYNYFIINWILLIRVYYFKTGNKEVPKLEEIVLIWT